ncbi:ankyrin repeat domain-containing protein 50 [Microdochium nivale]|nr:ankyrin repeat domain-containing protein 50 [Microdochium nivale]
MAEGRKRPRSDTSYNDDNITPRQVRGPTEANNAFVENTFSGSTSFYFNEGLGGIPRAQAEKRGMRCVTHNLHRHTYMMAENLTVNLITAYLRSLAFGEIHARRHDIAVAHPDTCEWLFQTPEFRQWCDPNDRHTHFGVLWIKGKPGAGKSTLMKHAFSRFQKDTFCNYIIVAHFFNARGFALEKTPLGLLRSIVYQLLQDEEVYSLFEPLLRDKELSNPTGTWEWRLGELQDIVQAVLTQPRPRPLLLLVDALDECGESQARQVVEFLESLSICAFRTGTPLQICLSSRHYPSIGMNKVIELVVEKRQDHRADIAKYVSDKLRIRNAAIEFEITERANSVFLWVVIVVSILNKAYDEGRVEAMQKTLDEVPDELDKLFGSILENISDVAETLLILQWVLFSRRPLKLSELFVAVFQGVAPPPLDLMKQRITTSSRGLVEVRSGKSETVQFIHLSVEDFLYRRKKLSEIDPTLGPEPIALSHGRLWTRCWACIDQATTKTMDEAKRSDPFLEYAANNILHHADLALSVETVKANQDDNSPRSLGPSQEVSIKNWLRRTDTWFHWWKMFLIKIDDEKKQLLDEQGAGLLYISALFELPNLLRASLEVFDIDAKGGHYGTALGAACHRGNYHIAVLLIQSGADINAQGGYYGYALQAACCCGTLLITNLLIQKGANVNAQGGKYGNALHAACRLEVFDKWMVKLLIDAGADVNAQGGRYGTALQATCAPTNPRSSRLPGIPNSPGTEQYNESVVKMLLDAGTEVNVQGKKYPSDGRHSREQESIVKLLLDNGANANAQGGEYGNALQAACEIEGQNEQTESVVKLLLDSGADVNAQDGYYGNALQAASSGSPRLLKLLLDAGAHVNAQGGEDGNALLAACQWGINAQSVKLLLDAGANVNAQGGKYGTALQAACSLWGEQIEWDEESECEEEHISVSSVVILLLDAGADVNAQGGRYGTGNALQAASSRGFQDVVELLLDAGADVNAQGGYYGNALQAASYEGHQDVVQLLLDAGADVNAQGGYYGNALQAASYEGHQDVVQLLLDAGADVNAQGGRYGNALQAASSRGYQDVVELLLDAGATANMSGT